MPKGKGLRFGTQLITAGSMNTEITIIKRKNTFLVPLNSNLPLNASLESSSLFTFLESTNIKIIAIAKMLGIQIYQTCCTTQKKSTPLRKPRNSGGSPIGVSAPPILLTIKIKNIIW